MHAGRCVDIYFYYFIVGQIFECMQADIKFKKKYFISLSRAEKSCY